MSVKYFKFVYWSRKKKKVREMQLEEKGYRNFFQTEKTGIFQNVENFYAGWTNITNEILLICLAFQILDKILESPDFSRFQR